MIRVSVDKLEKNGMMGVEEGGNNVLLIKVGSDYFALGDICPHKKCRLHTGTLKGTQVICPCHGATFDVTTGKLQAWYKIFPPFLIKLIAKIGIMNVKTYKCTVSGDEVLIET
ncbi:MAG: Rieske (2Fe-2S) protein [Nitrospirae bacterium]|nr:Rieske (2Fe-2S) protein [Nitrospirota bacterium]MBF0534470.1 Rieske (2Fe-2S) protein [Nitrospirota bacterium]MBF0617096.1 Rieske (2Fe-2S) protein [Nitrospirota bacterium]